LARGEFDDEVRLLPLRFALPEVRHTVDHADASALVRKAIAAWNLATRRRVDVKALHFDRLIGGVRQPNLRVEAVTGIDQELRKDDDRRRFIGRNIGR
jgi:hypothetical protein